MVFGYYSQFWKDVGVGSTGNLSPYLHNNCTSRIYLMELFGTLDFVEGLQLPREKSDSNLWLILVNFSYSHNSSFPSPSHVAGSYTLVPGAACTQHKCWRGCRETGPFVQCWWELKWYSHCGK